MAGSINLSLSQQFDRVTGALLSGGKLYFYQAGTDNPQNAYSDSGLTIARPNPITLDTDGRVPQLYFADGSIHVRLTNSRGVVQFDEDNVLVIGPSSGSGGGGGGVDPTAIFQTGDPIWVPTSGTRAGWVRANGRTMGSASSGASERSNTDCQALFEFLWTTYGDAICPVLGGRGASALIDWTANKQITLLDGREIIFGGLSDMGNADRAGFTNVPVERGGRTTPAGVIGEIQHTLLTNEIPTITPTGGINNPAIVVGDSKFGTQTVQSGIGAPNVLTLGGSSLGITATMDNPEIEFGSFGGNGTHNTTPRIMLGTVYLKL